MAKNTSRFTSMFLGGIAVLLYTGQTSAVPINVGDIIKNGGFGTNQAPSLQSWEVGQGVSQNARASTDAINTTGGNAGFNNFFGSAFAVLGDETGPIGGAPDGGRSLLFQGITLFPIVNGMAVNNYDITIEFMYAFDGDGDATQKDTFKAFFGNTTILSKDSGPFPDCGPAANCANAQIQENPFSKMINRLDPGNYTFAFELIEATGAATNTAAGVDNVSIKAVANVGQVPEPSTFALLGIGAFALGRVRERKTVSCMAKL